MAAFSVTVSVEDGLTVTVEAQLDQDAYSPDVITDLAGRAVGTYAEAMSALREQAQE